MKPNVAVIMGGYTSEYEISLKSGSVVVQHLNKTQYRPYPVRIDKKGWTVLVDDTWLPIDQKDFSCGDLIFDVVFNAVHGAPGENGELQAYFDKRGIPYTGCSAEVSALTYNKSKTLDFLQPYGISMAHRMVISKRQEIDTKRVVETVGLPCFVKANQAGSSFGVSKVYEASELLGAIAKAFQEDDCVLIESFLEGTEVSIGVITYEGKVRVLAPTEIVSSADFFDYAAKYEGQSEEITPARLSEKQLKNLNQAALKVYASLGMKGFSRSDFIFVGDIPYFLEINTVPGLTEASLLPQQARHAGIPLSELFEAAIAEALKK
ncbi:MAG: D-alanine--D-alanine ligase [Flavobacteriaceae bacterium]